jgi:hypothetical protein
VSLLALDIAGVRMDLDVPESGSAALSRYRPFESADGPPLWKLELRSTASGLPATPGRAVIEVDGRWRVLGAEEAGWLDPASGIGQVGTDPELYLLDTLLRAAVGSTVLFQGGLLVHGAAVVVDGRAHLFPARSGSGKSTLASRASHPLSDEISLLQPAASGFVAHATPWWLSRGGSAPLGRIYELAWNGEGVVPMRRSAVRQLVTNMLLPLDTPQNRGRALATAAAVAGSVPFARLSFRPDSDVDRLLRGPYRQALGVG